MFGRKLIEILEKHSRSWNTRRNVALSSVRSMRIQSYEERIFLQGLELRVIRYVNEGTIWMFSLDTCLPFESTIVHKWVYYGLCPSSAKEILTFNKVKFHLLRTHLPFKKNSQCLLGSASAISQLPHSLSIKVDNFLFRPIHTHPKMQIHILQFWHARFLTLAWIESVLLTL